MIKEVQITKEKLEFLFENLAKEDYLELKSSIKENLKEIFIKMCLQEKNAIMLSINNKIIAIGWVSECNYENKVGRLWLLITRYAKNHRIELFNYLNKKIDDFKKEYKVLFNEIYKSNFKIIPFLKKNGFKIKNSKNKNYKIFYFNKGGNFDI